jgi:tRNA modification GTPase
LTPSGSGAIATLALEGPGAWSLARQFFRPAGTQPLPNHPVLHRVWLGNFGSGIGDEVLLAVIRLEPVPTMEIHCHGGPAVVNWIVDQLVTAGCQSVSPGNRTDFAPGFDARALQLLAAAPTLRIASILLDQYHGAFHRAIQTILANPDSERPALQRLAELAPLGRHLVQPWRVVIAGPPNVGKSSLLNALAGYQRSVVAPVAGTTRDVVTASVAFDGWPVELHDTAGLRESNDELEQSGIGLARVSLASADLILWVMDLTNPVPEQVPLDLEAKSIRVGNKADQPIAWDAMDRQDTWGVTLVSAETRQGLPELISDIVTRLVPHPPETGEAVPFTPELAREVERAWAAIQRPQPDEAREMLRRMANSSFTPAG